MSYKSHHHIYIIQCMKVNMNARGITHERPKESSPSHTVPHNLTYSVPLPLWRQAPKPKGRTAGQEQSSRALRRGERPGTELHHPLTLNSEGSDPLYLEVKVKQSGSALGLAWPVTLDVSL